MSILYNLSKADIKPFSKKTLETISGEDFLENNEYFAIDELKWGDVIQINSGYRNENKYIWNNRWYSLEYDADGPYFDYGVLPLQFSLLDPDCKLPLNYFEKSIEYNNEAYPWDPKWYENELIQNYKFNNNKYKATTFFTHNGNYCFISTNISNLIDILPGIREGGSSGGSDGYQVHFTIKDSHFKIPKYFHKFINKDINQLNQLKKDDQFSMNFSTYDGFRNARNIVIDIEIDNNNISLDDIKNKFIENIMKSKYLLLEDSNNGSYNFEPIY
jgi:signal peptidase I